MTCSLSEGKHEADWDVIQTFDKKTGAFSLYTNDAYVYNREDLKMRVTCKSDLSDSEVVDEVTIQIRKAMKKSVRKESKAGRRLQRQMRNL